MMTTTTVPALWSIPTDAANPDVLIALGAYRIAHGVLTTDHAQSSHHVPVCVEDGQAYGPADLAALGVEVISVDELDADERHPIICAARAAGYRIRIARGLDRCDARLPTGALRLAE